MISADSFLRLTIFRKSNLFARSVVEQQNEKLHSGEVNSSDIEINSLSRNSLSVITRPFFILLLILYAFQINQAHLQYLLTCQPAILSLIHYLLFQLFREQGYSTTAVREPAYLLFQNLSNIHRSGK